MDLIHLPAELIAQIFEYLSDTDVWSTRLSHRALDRASFSYLGHRFFRKRGFMITSPSLDVLQQIADHQELRKYVQHVWFNPDCYTFARPECAPADEDDDLDEADELVTPQEKNAEALSESRQLLARQYDAYRACMDDHEGLMYGGRLEPRLANAFRLLPNLETVGMRRSEDYSPYGWTLLDDAIGEDPRVLGPIPSGPAFTLSGPTQLFVAVIAAVASTGTQLRRLYTDAIEIDNISGDMLQDSQFEAACNSIWYVELNAIKGWLTKHPVLSAQDYKLLNETSEYGSGLVRLCRAMPNLKEIGLQVFRDRKQSHLTAPSARNPESWKASYPYLTLARLSEEVSLPFLTRIKLEKVTSTSAILRRFLEPCAANLKSLKLRDIRLLSLEEEEETRPWQTIFAFLSERCTELDYILFYHLMYEGGGISYIQDPPSAAPAGTEDYLLDYVPPSHVTRALFTDYEHVTLEVNGREEVRAKLEEVQEKHWYQKPLFSYAMDEELWHTDTSDEEW